MDQISQLKNLLLKHKEQFPKSKKFPQEFWDQVILLTEKMNHRVLAEKLNIDPCYLLRKCKNSSSQKPSPQVTSSFVQATSIMKSKQITLELPHNITIRIDL